MLISAFPVNPLSSKIHFVSFAINQEHIVSWTRTVDLTYARYRKLNASANTVVKGSYLLVSVRTSCKSKSKNRFGSLVVITSIFISTRP